jgi:phosphatidylglycerol:prolipoprotein diacylglycerol transferase
MSFPVYIEIASLRLHPHFVFESLAYFIGFRLYLLTRRKERIPTKQAMWVLVGATLGAAIGSKLLYLLEDPVRTISQWNDWMYIMGGKTIVGGLLGGLIGVEWMKKKIGLAESTGDDLVFPLITGMAIGRIGCFLTGLSDHTYGTPTDWIIGVDFGDGIPRHPTQLYEIFFLLFLALFIYLVKKKHLLTDRSLPEGALFQCFMAGYLLFRFFIDMIKPTPHPFFGFNNIQIACLAGLVYYAPLLKKWAIAREITGKDNVDA